MAVAALKEPEKPAVTITIYQAMESLRHFECQQNPEELAELTERAKGKTSYLEIGSNFGGTLWRVGKELAPKSKIVCIDLPDPAHVLLDPTYTLKFNCQRLCNLGHEVQLVLADSHKPNIREFARSHGPYDLIFIDGDHSYEGVKQDWIDYGEMGKIVAFHDIAGVGTQGCVQFWKELKAEGKYRTEEFDKPRILEEFQQGMRLGIGIVYRES